MTNTTYAEPVMAPPAALRPRAKTNGGPADIRLATLVNYYMNLQHAGAAELFTGMLRARASAYGSFYSERYLPLDRSDFIAEHHLLCTVGREGLVPQASFKQVALDVCDAYEVRFPMLDWTKRIAGGEHERAVEALVEGCRAEGRPLVYGGHLALRKDARPRTLPRLLRELTAAVIYGSWKEREGFTEVAVSILRTRTNVWFEEIGFKPMSWRGLTLPAIPHAESPQDHVLFMEMGEPSAWARRCYETHKPLLDGRVLVCPP